MWHWAKFERPVKVWIAGTVDVGKADAAEQDLISLLVNAGYRLTNSQVSAKSARTKQRTNNLELLKREEILEYTAKFTKTTTVLNVWKNKWTSTLRGQTTYSKAHTANPQVLRDICKELVQKDSRSSDASIKLSNLLIEAYDFREDVVPYEAIAHILQDENFFKAFNSLSGIWHMAARKKIPRNRKIRFTRQFKQEAIAYLRRNYPGSVGTVHGEQISSNWFA